MRRLNLRNRRGVFVVIFGIMIVGLMAAAAVSIDLTRTWAFRNELQTSADAAALAGAVQLSGGTLDPAAYADSARAYAWRNRALQDSVDVDLVELGNWDDSLAVFTSPAPGGLPANAVRVVVSHDVTGLWGNGLLGIVPFKVHARAIAWADAGVTNTACIRPWAIPYQALLSRVNTARGIPNDAAGLSRDFTPEDRAALDTMDVGLRTFKLTLGSQTLSNFGDVTQYTGNYQAVQLPKKRDKNGVPNPDFDQGGGAGEYEDAVAGVDCHDLQIGDVLGTAQGIMPEATIGGVDANDGDRLPGVCDVVVGNKPYDKTDRTDPTFGDCRKGDGVGADVKAAFFLCTSACNGTSEFTVKMLGSFTLTKIYPGGDTGSKPAFSKGEIVGIFNPIQDGGEVGPGSSTLRRIILVECQAGRSPCT